MDELDDGREETLPGTDQETEMFEDDETPTDVATEVVNAILEQATVFRTPDDRHFVTTTHRGVRSTLSLDGTQAAEPFVRDFWYRKKGGSLSSESVRRVVATLRAQATYSEEVHDVFVRTAYKGDNVYLDLADKAGNVVVVSPGGWNITRQAPVAFLRPAGMLALPTPQRGSDSTEEFADFGRILGLSRAVLLAVLIWMLTAFRGKEPFPCLFVNGPQGCGKTFLTRAIRRVVDPAKPMSRSLPSNERDLAICAQSCLVPTFDNISKISPDISDALCRLSSGGGFATRLLWSDGEEKRFDSVNPVLANGIEEFATRSDLLDRVILIGLDAIPPKARRKEKELIAELDAQAPKLLGALLDALSYGLAQPPVELDDSPRMADFLEWGMRVAPALGGTARGFADWYQANRQESSNQALDSSPLTPLIVGLAENGDFSGTNTRLLEKLAQKATKDITSSRDWPKTARALTNSLNRIKPNLAGLGVKVSSTRDTTRNRNRVTTITLCEPQKETDLEEPDNHDGFASEGDSDPSPF